MRYEKKSEMLLKSESIKVILKANTPQIKEIHLIQNKVAFLPS